MITKRIQVLVLEDDPSMREIIRTLLGVAANSEYQVTETGRLTQGLDMLAIQRFDVILLDLDLDDSTGLDTFRRIQEANPELPVVILSGTSDRVVWETAVREGAQDYLVKGAEISIPVLTRSIQYAIERKQVYNRLQQSNVNLSQMTKRLENAIGQVQEMTRQTEMAHALQSDFMANVSHELRTPMNAIIGMTALLDASQLSDSQKKHTAILKNAAEDMLRLINDILDFSKLDTGALKIAPVPFDLAALVLETASNYRSAAECKGLKFSIYSSPTARRRLIGDAGRIRQVLSHLVANAVKFTPTGKIYVGVDCANTTIENTYEVTFQVRDTGPGIPEDQLPAVFDRFRQFESSATRRYGGTGIGLAICRQLVELMGGSIRVQSVLGSGSLFYFKLNLKGDPPVEQMRDIQVDPSRIHVLVVQRDEATCAVIAEQLQSRGMLVETVTSFDQVVPRLKRADQLGDPFDIALLDDTFPDLPASDIPCSIRSDSAIPDLALVLLATSGEPGDGKRMSDAGYDAYLVKPFEHDLLINMVLAASTRKDESGQPMITRHSLAEARWSRYKEESASLESLHAHVLVVDDSRVNQIVVSQHLTDLACDVDVAENGKQATDLVDLRCDTGEDERPSVFYYDAVFMDCQMPEMDGFETARLIRMIESDRLGDKDKGVPIIGLTAQAPEKVMEKCLAAGMNDCIAKPATIKDLHDALKRWIDPLMILNRQEAAEKELPPASPSKTTKHTLPLLYGDRAQDVMDIDEFLDSLGQAQPIARGILETYLDEGLRQYEGILQSIENKDHLALYKHVHTLKGASYTILAKPFGDYLQKLEDASESQDHPQIHLLLPQLQPYWDQVTARIREVLEVL